MFCSSFEITTLDSNAEHCCGVTKLVVLRLESKTNLSITITLLINQIILKKTTQQLILRLGAKSNHRE